LKLNRLTIVLLLLIGSASFGQAPGNAPYQDPSLTPERRAEDLVSRMTLEEKILQMQNSAPAIPRLGVGVFNYWNEALHGVASGRATVFPEPIGLGASFDTDLVHRIADAISTEARAKYHEAQRHDPIPEVPPGNSPGRIAWLTYWSPNINIFRDPRWGRGQETYGEDPFLTSRMGVAFVTGMQGDDPHYLKVVATPKHYAVHSGPEPLRHTFDVKVSESDMVNTYLPAFRAAIVEGKADSIMCVYNSVDGVPGCASTDLLQKRLRDQWGFQGFVVSDCGAVGDIYRSHKYVATQGEAAVAAVKAGTDLTCGGEYRSLIEEVKAGHITEAEITRAAERLFVARIRLGMFDPPERVPYTKIPYSENDSAAHRQLALIAEREAIVLLKNQNGILPLKSTVKKIAVIGPSADDPIGLLGNYNGISSKQVTPLEGITKRFASAKVLSAQGATYSPTAQALVSSNFLTTPDGKGQGLQAEYFDNPDFQGQPKLRRTEPRVYFDANMEEPAVVAAVHGDKYSIRWTGTLTPPATGDYVVSARTGQWNRDGKIKLFLDDQEVNPSGPAGARPTGLGPGQGQGQGPGPGGRRGPAPMQLAGGRKYAVKIEYTQNGRGGGAEFNWMPPAAVMLAEAEKVAKDSDVALVFVGLNGSIEGEGHDRSDIDDRHGQAGSGNSDQRQRSGREFRRGGRGGDALGLVRRRGSRHGDCRYSGRRQQSGGPSSGDVLQEYGPAALIHRLQHEGPHLPLFHGRTAVSIRLRVELFDLCIFRPDREAYGGRRGNPGDGKEHFLQGRRRSGAVVHLGWNRERRGDPQPARVPTNSPSCGREPASDLHGCCRRLAEIDGGGQRWRGAARGQHTACEGFTLDRRFSKIRRFFIDSASERVRPRR
jgi:beta-glucosidase